VVDSKNKDKFGEAADTLYEILNNITVLSNQTPILIACNKQDLPLTKSSTIMEIELEKEMEEIRKVKKATQDDSQKIGYLETLKKKFSFADMHLPI
jgi:signal recognition particle receptor subunit beta